MPQYARAHIPGGTLFFTVALLERKRDLLVAHIDVLRQTSRIVQGRHPFRIDAMVVLSDHLHCLLTLPPEDSNFSTRWRLIKTAFAR
jgi:putative transposase